MVQFHKEAVRGVPLEFQMKYLVLEFQAIPLEYLQGLGVSEREGTQGYDKTYQNVPNVLIYNNIEKRVQQRLSNNKMTICIVISLLG